jgi:DNA-binding response OmpR family regulator
VQSKASPRILIVEDDTRLLRALSYFLRKRGLDVVEAMDGEAGLAAYERSQPDLLIIDNSLPNKLGYEVCQELRRRRGAQLPIVMISAFLRMLGNEDENERPPIDVFIRKPFQLDQLWRTIESLRQGNRFIRPHGETPVSGVVALSPDVSAELPSEGSCQRYPVVYLLAQALAQQATGILTLQEDKARIRRIYLANGFPAFARSNLITETLLRFLLKSGEIDAETYRRHLPKMQEERWRPGATLVREGALTVTRLNRAHRALVEEIIQTSFAWSEAAFEYRSSQRPIEQAVIYDINPFRLLDQWLESSFSDGQILDRYQLLLAGRMLPTPQSESWHYLLEWALSLDPGLEEVFNNGGECAELLDVAPERRPLRARLIQCMLMMGFFRLELPNPADVEPVRNALTRLPSTPDASASTTGFRKRSPSASAVPKAAAPVSQPKVKLPEAKGDGQDQLRRIYDVVLRDFRRIQEVSNPYEALCVSRTEPVDVIRRRYERFERFYRPENFQRIGDSKLYSLAVEIRQALARAMAEIENSSALSGLGERPSTGVSFGPTSSWFEPPSNNHPLAQILFNDGLTYLRLGDFLEADLHFRRAVDEAGANGMFDAYIVWTAYLKANRSVDAAGTARLALEKLVERYPGEDTAYHFLAHIHRELGHLEHAVSYYRKAAELNPENRSARLFLKRLMGNEG